MTNFKIASLKLANLPHSDKILLPSDIADRYATKHKNSEYTYVITGEGQRFGLEVKRISEGNVQIGLTLRALLNVKPSAKISLLKPNYEDFQMPYINPFRKFVRFVLSLNEASLARLLGAPNSIFRTATTYAGDDDRYLVRLHPSLFVRLGATPGDHVFVERMGRKIVAVAFEDIADEEFKESKHLKKSQAVGKHTSELPKEFPAYLLARVSPQARSALGISVDDVTSIVSIKRRVQTRLLSEFNRILLPITVLALTISTTNWDTLFKVSALVILVPIIIAISLAPIKIKHIPSGLWY